VTTAITNTTTTTATAISTATTANATATTTTVAAATVNTTNISYFLPVICYLNTKKFPPLSFSFLYLICLCPGLFLRISGLKILIPMLCLCMTLRSVDHERKTVVYFQGITHMKEHSAGKGQNGLHAHSRTHTHT
jgi:hypothetical protein